MRLEQLVTERTAELANANERLQEEMAARERAEAERRETERQVHIASRLAIVGAMASGIAHEMNNPLTSVLGFAQLALTRQNVPDEIRDDLNIITENARRAADIVKRLLVFAGQQGPERRHVNINDVVATALELRAYSLKSNNIKVITRLAPGLPGTTADAGQLQQVFLNLIINAETEMRLAHSGGNLHIRTELASGAIRITFEDDGPGISKGNMEKLFTPFFTTREVGQGMGLGLSVCHGIVTAHGGRTYAESELGKGAAFIVELPVVSEG